MPVSMPWAGGTSIGSTDPPRLLSRVTNSASSCNVNGKILLSRIFYSSLSTCHLYSHSGVLHDLSSCASDDVDPIAINSAERLRLVHSYVKATPSGGGLGIHPDNDRVHRGHDPEFNNRWNHTVTEIIDIGHMISFVVRYVLPSSTWCPLTPTVRRRRRSISRFPGFLHS
jgi:hypothetical protein